MGQISNILMIYIHTRSYYISNIYIRSTITVTAIPKLLTDYDDVIKAHP